MSRTYRNIPHKRWLRRPRGKKQAIIRGSRPKGIPPDAWDDYPISALDEKHNVNKKK